MIATLLLIFGLAVCVAALGCICLHLDARVKALEDRARGEDAAGEAEWARRLVDYFRPPPSLD